MKLKKLLCPLLAGAMLCGSAALPVAAEEATTYQMGDVNMDGAVKADDAVLVFCHYLRTVICHSEPVLTDEQLALANVQGLPEEKFLHDMPYSATCIMRYHVFVGIFGMDVTMDDIVAGTV